MPRLYRECKQCKKDFYITETGQEYFIRKQLELPKRCWKCRQQNREEMIEAIAKQKKIEQD